MKILKNILFGIPIVAIALCLIAIAIPFFIIASPLILISEIRFKKKYRAYLETLNGKNFFCYNNRKKGFEYLQNQIIPNLPNDVDVLYLNGRKIESNKYDTKYLSRAFYSFKNYSKFPQLLKVRNGEMDDCSLNNELFNCLNQGKDESHIIDKVNKFFEIKNNTTP